MSGGLIIIELKNSYSDGYSGLYDTENQSK